jgi:hypothetical protein
MRSGVYILAICDCVVPYPPSASQQALRLKEELKQQFKVTDLGPARQFLDM